MTDLLPALSGAFGDRPDAVVVDGEATSWENLRDRAQRLADRATGAPALAVHATASLDTVVAVVAGLLAGVPVVPMAPDAGPLERDHVLSDSGAVAVADLPGDGPRIAGDAALILYTSGTTGAPKGVQLSAAALAADLDALAEAWAWTPDDTLVHGLPLFHVHGLVLGLLGALRTGSRLVHTGRPAPATYASARGTLYFGVPTVWSRIVAEPDAARELRAARLLVSGSAALPVPVFARLEELTGHRPVERYGMTETLITISSRADGERRPGHVGTPLAGVEARLAGEDGELQVRGTTLFDGYLNRPSPFTEDGWFATGDIAELVDGQYRIVGRASTDLIKSGGYRIGAGEVENALLAHPGVREAAVVGMPHEDLGQEVVAFVVASGVTARDLIDFVARELSVHKRPRRVVLVGALPRNAMGKVQKKLLCR
ncbi:acyl-CoA synthetase [Longispora fulva]|uniref:Fatty acid CoA ligase FadD36 n=1 Tax=Longispora fulva TaxID=619741 RepID=A0A8J7KKE1_9ACTN|nr:AMP-binding protein [Longispora fulva]MBG6137989.1 fatty acid CoA ligase FadD36 [Longispora fulva]GIG60242.1 acyl-CoA synthetase [Longispora fulva]